MKISELSQDSLSLFRQKIEQTLSQIGMSVEDEVIRETCRAAGCVVKDDRVLFPTDVLHTLLSRAPKKYTVTGLTGKEYTIGGGRQWIAGIVVDPWINDPETGVRRPAMNDLMNNLALMEHYDGIAQVSRMDFPMTDYPGADSSYRALEAFFRNCSKHISAYCTSPESLQEYFDVAKAALGVDSLKGTNLYSVAVATLSPLGLSRVNCELLKMAVANDFPIVPTTCPMAGTTSPYSLASTFIQGMAEAVGLCAIVQAVNPGNPYLFAYGPSVSSMQDGHDMYYTPDKFIWKVAVAEVARSYGLPVAIEGGGNTPAGFDMQCGAESAMHMFTAVGSCCDMLCGVGSCYNANGLSAENIVIGMALNRMSHFTCRGMRTDDIDDAITSMEDSLEEGNYLTDELTIRNLRTGEFFTDPIFNLMGEFQPEAPTMLQRAQAEVRRVRESFVSPIPEDMQERIHNWFCTHVYNR